MAIEKVSVSKVGIADVPGALKELMSGVAANGGNILQAAAFSTGGGEGEAYLVVDKPQALSDYVSSRGVAVTEYSGVLLTGSDNIGVGADLTMRIADAGVNIKLATSTVVAGVYHVMVVVDIADGEEVVAALGA